MRPLRKTDATRRLSYERRDEPRPSLSRRHAVLAFLSALALYLALTPWIYDRWVPTGDEPHYLLATHSLLADGDINLRNNYEEGDYRRFYPSASIEPHIARTEDGVWLPIHEIALSLILAPAYRLGGRLGVLYFLDLIAALVAANIWLLTYEASRHRVAAWLGWLGTICTMPLLPYAFQVYPEMMGALLAVWLARQVACAGRLTPWRGVGIGICLVGLIWLSLRFLPIVAVVLFLLLVRALRQGFAWKAWAALTATVGASLYAVSALNRALYGGAVAVGASTAERIAATPGELFDLWNHFDSFFGWLLDQRIGLFSLAPVYILAPLGALFFWRRDRWWAMALGGILLAQHLSLGFSKFLVRGGIPPRYLVAVLPLTSAFLAVAWAEMRSKLLLGGSLALLGLSLANASFVIASPSRAEFGHYDESKLLRLYGDRLSLDLNRFFPLFMPAMRYKDKGWDDHVEGSKFPLTYAFPKYSPITSPVGRLVEDKGAAEGMATYLPAGRAVICLDGPRLSLPPGGYTLIYRLRTDAPVSPTAPVAVIAVQAGVETLAQREVLLEGEYAEQGIAFALASRQEVACTLLSTGVAPLWADYVLLRPHDPWRARLLAILWAGGIALLTVYGYSRRDRFARQEESEPLEQERAYWIALPVLVLAVIGLVIRQLYIFVGPRNYEGESLPHLVGEVMADGEASGGKAIWKAAGDGAGWLVYGPYALFSPGVYQACFRLKASSGPPDAALAWVDVAADLGQEVLARRQVRSGDLGGDSYTDLCLGFQNSIQQPLEFRVHTLAAGDLWFDRVQVSRYLFGVFLGDATREAK